MKKILSMIIVLTLCLGLVPSYGATSKIDANLLKQLNLINFSNQVNDKNNEVKKWVKTNYKEEDNLYNVLAHGHEAYIKDAKEYKILSKRKVVQNWTAKGSADANLGQCYISKVDLSVIATDTYYEVLTTQAWVKKVGGKYVLKKVTYSAVKRDASDAELAYEDEQYDTLYTNRYFFFNDYQDIHQGDVDASDSDYTSTFSTENGVNIIVDPETAFISGERIHSKIPFSQYDSKKDYVFAQVTVDDAVELVPAFAILGLKKDLSSYSGVIDIVDNATQMSAEIEEGKFDLKPGITYNVVFKGNVEFAKYTHSLILLWATYNDRCEVFN